MGVLFLLVTSVLATSILGVKLNKNSYCTQEAPVFSEPVRPSLAHSYSTQIAVKSVTSKRMEYMYEYFDADRQLLSFSLTRFGHLDIRYYDLKNKKISSIYKDKCFTNTDKKYTDGIKASNIRGLDLIMGLGKVWKYKNETTIKGVAVQKWTSCSSWDVYANFTADYYFTKKDNIPFRLELKGIKEDGKGGTKKILIISDYFLFSLGTPPADSFKPPPGIICDLNTKSTPPMPDSASYSEEELDINKKTVGYINVFFDKQLQLSKEDHQRGQSIVNDYKRGIQYKIDNYKYTCSRSALFVVASREDYLGKTGRLHMQTLKHFFLDDGNFTYNGQYKARGILCDVYSRQTKSAENMGNSLVEIYVSAKSVSLANYQGKVTSTKQVVVRVVIKGGGQGTALTVQKQYEMYNFDPEPLPRTDPFNIFACFGRNQMISFNLVFKGPSIRSWNERKVFLKGILLKLSDTLTLSPLRMSIFQAMNGDGQVNVKGYIFEREKPQSLFKSTFHKTLTAPNNYAYSNSSNTPNICASYCTKDIKRPFANSGFCFAFTFNEASKDCVFYFTYAAFSKKYFKRSWSTDLYQRDRFDNLDRDTMATAFSKLQAKVYAGTLSYTDGKGNVFTATSVEKNARHKKKSAGSDSAVKSFRASNHFKLTKKPREILTGYLLDACARQCLNNIKYDCEAFIYQRKNMKCSLYDEKKYRYTRTYTSTVYYRQYAKNFIQMPGLSALKGSGPIFMSTYTSNDCAKLCMKYTVFSCESFELCGPTCRLGNKHFFDIPKTNIKTDYSCVHYSRSYIEDYNKITHKKSLKNSNVVELKSASVQTCAKLCSTSPDYDCDIFEFCSSNTVCRVTTKAVLKASSLAYKSTGDCDLYSRMKARSRLIHYQASTQSSGHSAGSMGGLAIGMIILGILVIVGGALLFIKLKNRTGTVTLPSSVFSKKRLEEEEQ